MIYVRILVVCYANYVKISTKLFFILHKPSVLRRICHNIITCVVDEISLCWPYLLLNKSYASSYFIGHIL